ncbi:MAG: radical SAM protein [Bacteriovoracaceae bacterium]|nr:radical SAM protein [Bacteriovoracaceae bacterium]
MNVLLVRPGLKKEKVFSLQMGHIATQLKLYGHNITVQDELVCEYDHLEVDHVIVVMDYVGGVNPSRDSKAFAVWFDHNKYNVPVILVGEFPTLFPLFCFEELGVDYIIPGDPEEAITYFLSGDKSNLKYEVWKKTCRNFSNVNKLLSLDALPLVDFRLFKMNAYASTILAKGDLVIPLETSRGCRFSCTYCLTHNWRENNNIYMSQQRVLEHITHAINSLKCNHFIIEDNMFLGNIQHVVNLLSTFIDNKVSINWECLNGVRIDTLTRDLITQMCESGLKHLAIGVEGISNAKCLEYGRSTDMKKLKQVINWCHQLGINISGYYIIPRHISSFQAVALDILSVTSNRFDFIHFSILRRRSLTDYYPFSIGLMKVFAYGAFFLRPNNLLTLIKRISKNKYIIKKLYFKFSRW